MGSVYPPSSPYPSWEGKTPELEKHSKAPIEENESKSESPLQEPQREAIDPHALFKQKTLEESFPKAVAEEAFGKLKRKMITLLSLLKDFFSNSIIGHYWQKISQKVYGLASQFFNSFSSSAKSHPPINRNFTVKSTKSDKRDKPKFDEKDVELEMRRKRDLFQLRPGPKPPPPFDMQNYPPLPSRPQPPHSSLHKEVNIEEALEKAFAASKALYFPSWSGKTAESLASIKKDDKESIEKNPHAIIFKQLVKAFGLEILKPTLKDTLDQLFEKQSVKIEPDTLNRDCALFSCSELEMKLLYAKRLAKAQRTGFAPSVVTSIETIWQEMRTQREQKSQTKKIGNYFVTFDPPRQAEGKEDSGGVYIKEKYLNSGNFKAAFLATSFFDIKKAAQRREFVILQPKDSVADEIPAAIAPEIVERPSENKNKPSIEVKTSQRKEEKTSSSISSGTSVANSGTSVVNSGTSVVNSGTSVVNSGTSVVNSGTSVANSETSVVNPGAFVRGEEIEEETHPSVKESSSPLGAFQEEAPKVFTSTEAKVGEPANILDKQAQAKLEALELYKKEAELCLEVGKLPGIWETHKVTEINGQVAIIQKAAGYKVKLSNGGGEEETAIDLDRMRKLHRKGRLSPESQIVYLKMIRDGLEGLSNLHQKNIIHRDVKPENILCAPDGKAGVCDLGAACKADDAQERKVFIGTNYFVAPEVCALLRGGKGKEIGPKADVWSVGIMLWQLVSGKAIYEHPSIRSNNPNAYQALAGVLKNPTLMNLYATNYPAPKPSATEPPEANIAHLIWQCTRYDHNERPIMEDVLKGYDAWLKYTIPQLESGKSLADCFGEYPPAWKESENVAISEETQAIMNLFKPK